MNINTKAKINHIFFILFAINLSHTNKQPNTAIHKNAAIDFSTNTVTMEIPYANNKIFLYSSCFQYISTIINSIGKINPAKSCFWPKIQTGTLLASR